MESSYETTAVLESNRPGFGDGYLTIGDTFFPIDPPMIGQLRKSLRELVHAPPASLSTEGIKSVRGLTPLSSFG
jgi:hypothetical protein